METIASLNLAVVGVMDILPVLVAFALGFGARLLGLPPLVGFLAAGFALGAMGMASSEARRKGPWTYPVFKNSQGLLVEGFRSAV